MRKIFVILKWFNQRNLCVIIWVAFLMLSLGSRANTAVEPVPKEGAGWERFHARFVAEAQKGNIDLLFVGDSITQYWGDPKRGLPVWKREFARRKSANFGINGDRIQHILWRLQNGEGTGFSPKVVVALIGTNNTTPRNTTQEVVAGATAVVEELKKGFPTTKILLLGILPRGKKEDPRRLQILEINRALATLDDAYRVFYLDIGERFLDDDGEIPIDIMPDGVHPSLKGYKIFAAAIKKPLSQLVASQSNTAKEGSSR